MIEILTSGAMNSVQDLGRPGLLDQGIGRGGAMDREALMLANRLVGNAAGAAAIEIAVTPFRLRFLADGRFAVTGADGPITLDGIALPSFAAADVKSGQELRIGPPRSGARFYVALSGGIDVPVRLGARATDLKSRFGGLDGRALQRGDRLATGTPARFPRHAGITALDPSAIRPTRHGAACGDVVTIRIMAGAEWDLFTDAARACLTGDEWIVSAENNRQGLKLDGAALALAERRELFSHGLMPGTIQVPPSGQPIIQLAEANTCGGYPKIAHVIEPDLGLLAQCPTASRIVFRRVDRQTAIDAIAGLQARMTALSTELDRLFRPEGT